MYIYQGHVEEQNNFDAFFYLRHIVSMMCPKIFDYSE